jgi:TPR repeat protein
MGVPRDYVEAGKWYEKAAAAGFDYANLNLAILFSRGQGCRKDVALAVQLAELAVKSDEEARDDLKSGWSKWTPEFLVAFQRRLYDLGLYKGAIDGRFGDATLAAIDALDAG